MASWFWGSSQFDEAVEKATSELNVAGQEDIALNLEICDQIRSKSIGSKEAMRSIKRRVGHQNPNVQLLTLSLLDVCIKNGGDHFLVEIASREFMDNLVSIIKLPALNREVKTRALRLVQNWAIGFEGKPSLSYVGEVYKTLQREGINFPPRDSIAANSAMVDTATAPEWIDSDVCLRCRTPFSFTNRKHHCRNCGQVFDHACSTKSLPLPHFGITQEVRVCDTCHVKLKKKNVPVSSPDIKHRRSQSHSHGPPRPKYKSAQELADEELQRAIALSLQEATPHLGRPGYMPATSTSWQTSEPPLVQPSTRSSIPVEEEDPDLLAAIEASLREASAPKPSAPVDASLEEAPHAYALPQAELGSDLLPLESDAILTFSQTVEEAQSRGSRDFVRYPGVSELYHKANGLQPKMSNNLEDTSRKEQMLTEMHEKLSEAVKLYDQLLTAQLRPLKNQQSAQPQPHSYAYGSQVQQVVPAFQQPAAGPQHALGHPNAQVTSPNPPNQLPSVTSPPAVMPQQSPYFQHQHQDSYRQAGNSIHSAIPQAPPIQHTLPHRGYSGGELASPLRHPTQVASPPPIVGYAQPQTPNSSILGQEYSTAPFTTVQYAPSQHQTPQQPIAPTNHPYGVPHQYPENVRLNISSPTMSLPPPAPQFSPISSTNHLNLLQTAPANPSTTTLPHFPAAPTAQPKSFTYSHFEEPQPTIEQGQKEAMLISFD